MAYIELGEICDIIKGEIGITKAVPGEYPMVTTGANRISNNKFQLDTEAVLVPLVSATGHGHASIKRIHYQEGKFAFGSILAACVPKDDKYSAKFLHIYFQLMKDYVLVPLMKGSANVSLTLGNLKTAKVPVISREIQESIVKLYSTLKIEQDEAITILSIQKKDIDALRQAILQEAVQGKLTAKWRAANPNIEPASELLKRIEAEKQQLIAEKKIRKEKPLPEISDDEVPYELPGSWVWCNFGELASFINGDRGKNYPNKSEYVSEGVAWINTGHIDPDGTLSSKRMNFITREKYDTLRSGKIQKRDLVYCLRGATFGKTAFVKPFSEGAVASSLMIIRSHQTEVADFIYRFLISPEGKKQLLRFDNGSAQPNLSANKVKLYAFPLPPIKEQGVIIDKVNSLMVLCDELEQQIQNSQTQIEQLMQSCLKEVFEVETISNPA